MLQLHMVEIRIVKRWGKSGHDWQGLAKTRGGDNSGSCPPKYKTDVLHLLLPGSLVVL